VLVAREQRRGMIASRLIPDTQQVVVGAAGEVAPVQGPLQAADLLCVGHIRADVMRRDTHVMLVYGASSTATAA